MKKNFRKRCFFLLLQGMYSIFLGTILVQFVHAETAVIEEITDTDKKKIHLVWMIDTDLWWEASWIRELLSAVQYEIVEVTDCFGFESYEDCICVTSFHTDMSTYERFFNKLHQNKCKFGIIHLSDEVYTHSTSCYAHAEFILRNYWHKNFIHNPKVMTIPLGYKTNFWANRPNKDTKSVLERQYSWSFAGGTEKSTRQSMIQNMKWVDNFLVHDLGGSSTKLSLSVEQYRDLLLDSTFAPCPKGGWNFDTFRLCEALECGCIPIVERKPFDYFARLFETDDPYLSTYPFLSVGTWDEIPTLLNKDFLSDTEQLEALRLECHLWWIAYKDHLKQKIATLVHNTF